MPWVSCGLPVERWALGQRQQTNGNEWGVSWLPHGLGHQQAAGGGVRRSTSGDSRAELDLNWMLEPGHVKPPDLTPWRLPKPGGGKTQRKHCLTPKRGTGAHTRSRPFGLEVVGRGWAFGQTRWEEKRKQLISPAAATHAQK